MTIERKFNLRFLEAFRLKFRATIPQPFRRIIAFSIMLGIPALLLYSIFNSIFTWWSIASFFLYFGISGLSIADTYIGKRRNPSPNKRRGEE